MKEPRKLTRLLFVSLALLGFTALAGCNTVEGIGKDLQGAGRAVEDAADR